MMQDGTFNLGARGFEVVFAKIEGDQLTLVAKTRDVRDVRIQLNAEQRAALKDVLA
tara:strand:- start:31 stop:198 length:168 start_codon:yes stop_codon:yes gene_type:complete